MSTIAIDLKTHIGWCNYRIMLDVLGRLSLTDSHGGMFLLCNGLSHCWKLIPLKYNTVFICDECQRSR